MARQFRGLGFLLLSVASVCSAADAPVAHFIGPEACALCHRAIAAQQKQTAMAATWQGCLTTWLPPAFQASAADDLPYELKRMGEAFTYSVGFGGTQLTLPVEVLMGGRRHGLGFLASIRPVRVESGKETTAARARLYTREAANARRRVRRRPESDVRIALPQLPWSARHPGKRQGRRRWL